jgi:hypothetical protein
MVPGGWIPLAWPSGERDVLRPGRANYYLELVAGDGLDPS